MANSENKSKSEKGVTSSSLPLFDDFWAHTTATTMAVAEVDVEVEMELEDQSMDSKKAETRRSKKDELDVLLDSVGGSTEFSTGFYDQSTGKFKSHPFFIGFNGEMWLGVNERDEEVLLIYRLRNIVKDITPFVWSIVPNPANKRVSSLFTRELCTRTKRKVHWRKVFERAYKKGEKAKEQEQDEPEDKTSNDDDAEERDIAHALLLDFRGRKIARWAIQKFDIPFENPEKKTKPTILFHERLNLWLLDAWGYVLVFDRRFSAAPRCIRYDSLPFPDAQFEFAMRDRTKYYELHSIDQETGNIGFLFFARSTRNLHADIEKCGLTLKEDFTWEGSQSLVYGADRAACKYEVKDNRLLRFVHGRCEIVLPRLTFRLLTAERIYTPYSRRYRVLTLPSIFEGGAFLQIDNQPGGILLEMNDKKIHARFVREQELVPKQMPELIFDQGAWKVYDAAEDEYTLPRDPMKAGCLEFQTSENFDATPTLGVDQGISTAFVTRKGVVVALFYWSFEHGRGTRMKNGYRLFVRDFTQKFRKGGVSKQK